MLRWVFIFLIVSGVARAADDATAMSVGQIKAESVIGDVNAINHDDKSVTPLHNDDVLAQGFTVKTGEDASIVLVFSNGATVRLAANTELSIDEFVQQPFPDDELVLDKLEKEPTKSSTKLRLDHGELVGHVLALRTDSTHIINTPAGAAGIRGTTFRHIARVAPNGAVVFSSATDEGAVGFTAADGQTATISAATEITGRARPLRRGITFNSHEITRRSKVVIDHHVKVMRAARARVRFRRAELPPPGSRPTLRRDPASLRETTNDFKNIDREEQDAIKAEQEKARAQKAKAAPAPKAPPAKKK
jgi:hypothetical protein